MMRAELPATGGFPHVICEKGEMLPIVVTIKDANGNPVGGEGVDAQSACRRKAVQGSLYPPIP